MEMDWGSFGSAIRNHGNPMRRWIYSKKRTHRCANLDFQTRKMVVQASYRDRQRRLPEHDVLLPVRHAHIPAGALQYGGIQTLRYVWNPILT